MITLLGLHSKSLSTATAGGGMCPAGAVIWRLAVEQKFKIQLEHRGKLTICKHLLPLWVTALVGSVRTTNFDRATIALLQLSRVPS
jgi:hypothetical protein